MTMTDFHLTTQMRPHAATGYQNVLFSDQPAVAPTFLLRGMSAAGQLYSCVVDLAKWLAPQFRTDQAVREGAQVLRGATLAEMQRVHYVDSKWEWGDCLAWRATRRGDTIYHRHGGGINGFVSLLTFSKRDRLGTIVLTNRWQFGAREDITWLMCDEVVPVVRETPVAQPPFQPTPVPEKLHSFLGRYQTRNAPDSNYVEIVWRDGSLAFGPAEPSAPAWKLLATDQSNVFVMEDGGEPVVFETAPNGVVVRMRRFGQVFSKVDLQPSS